MSPDETGGLAAHAACQGLPELAGEQDAGGAVLTLRSYDQEFGARADQVREARRFTAGALAGCPVADDAVLCVSELASNSIVHSASRHRGGTFTVHLEIWPGEWVWLEVRDRGGRWVRADAGDGRPHGLDIVKRLAADLEISGTAEHGWVVAARLEWPVPGAVP